MVRTYLDFLIELEGKIDDAHREIQKDISQHVEYFKDRTYEKELKRSVSRSRLVELVGRFRKLLSQRKKEPSIKGLGAVIHAYSPEAMLEGETEEYLSRIRTPEELLIYLCVDSSLDVLERKNEIGCWADKLFSEKLEECENEKERKYAIARREAVNKWIDFVPFSLRVFSPFYEVKNELNSLYGIVLAFFGEAANMAYPIYSSWFRNTLRWIKNKPDFSEKDVDKKKEAIKKAIRRLGKGLRELDEIKDCLSDLISREDGAMFFSYYAWAPWLGFEDAFKVCYGEDFADKWLVRFFGASPDLTIALSNAKAVERMISNPLNVFIAKGKILDKEIKSLSKIFNENLGSLLEGYLKSWNMVNKVLDLKNMN